MVAEDTPKPAARIITAKLRVPPRTGVVRTRLATHLGEVWSHRLTLIVAPAGSGKTTLLTQFAHEAPCPVAWLRAEPSDGSAEVFLAYLEAALTGALAGLGHGWASVEDAAAALNDWPGTQALLIIDDLHALQGTEAEGVLAHLLDYLPPGLAVVVSSRQQPGFSLSRLRVDEAVLELGPDDLRFRAWEVERLFWDFYGARLAPEELAVLARRTEGWAAGLQLFHLATRDRQVGERLQVLHGLGERTRLTREYLTDNVLAHLPAAQRDFLVRTSVLGRLSGPVCDALLDRSGSSAVLTGLVGEQLFTYELGDGWYRYHEVLRSHLEGLLAEQVDDTELSTHYRRAGQLLEAADQPAEALSAYSRVGDWAAVRRVLGAGGEAIAADTGDWLDALPRAMRDQDPWVLLASARRDRAEGRWLPAIEAFRRAEEIFGGAPAADHCRWERRALALWVGPSLEQREDWIGLARRAITRDPLAVLPAATELEAPYDSLVEGFASLFAGHVGPARRALSAAASHPSIGAATSIGAQLGAGAAGLLADDAVAAIDLEWAATEAHRLDLGWLARMGHVLLSLTPASDAATPASQSREPNAEAWSQGITALVDGLKALRATAAPPDALMTAAKEFEQLDARTLTAWCLAVESAASARSGQGDVARAREAVSVAHVTGVPGAEAIALMALVELEGTATPHAQAVARELLDECGLMSLLPRPAVIDVTTGGPLRIRCFGGFELQTGAVRVDIGALKPRARSLLRLLALHAGRPVHREVILEALWHDADREVGTRGLHVTLSSLRHQLGIDTLIARDGEAYRLVINEGDEVDTLAFERWCLEGRSARARGDAVAALHAAEAALEIYTDDLLPEEGPADWVVGYRDRYRSDAIDAATALAALRAERGDINQAVAVCEKALGIDRYRDTVWQQLIELHERAGNRVAAAKARKRYATLLHELGIEP